jgi:hypothetical protein
MVALLSDKFSNLLDSLAQSPIELLATGSSAPPTGQSVSMRIRD